jgi:hypothetical protein
MRKGVSNIKKITGMAVLHIFNSIEVVLKTPEICAKT